MAITGNIISLIQAPNGDVLAGTNTMGRIYRSTDNGLTWTASVTLGDATTRVSSLAKDNLGYLYAAVSHGTNTSVNGIWRSQDNGFGWLKVYSHADFGILDIAARGGRIVAVGSKLVIISLNNGTTWSVLSTAIRSYIKAATHKDIVLESVWEGMPFATVPQWFIGTELYPSEQFGVAYTAVGNPPYGLVPMTTSGAGAGIGLDMAAFLVKENFDFRMKALWAVYNPNDVSSTDIWGWPLLPFPAGTVPKWAKIATIPSAVFNVLYVEPSFTNWQSIGAHRTIWAGANGTIYVSYNSGLTWAVATTAPTGQMYAFVRTTSGVLIAGGANGEIFLFSGSGSEGGGNPPGGGGDPDTPPEEPEDPDDPEDPGIITSRFLGRLATKEKEIFVSNKFSFSNVTHIFHYNGVSYSNLQFAAAPPYSLFSSTAAVNKAVYFGSRTGNPDVPGGTFSSLIFDITQESKNITIVWEYWNGSAWTALAVQDNTDQFKLLGVGSVSWQIPTNWTAVTVNAVTGYWVRARISAVAADPQTPIQGNRFIYTTLLPYTEIAATQIQGDLPANGRITWHNQSGIDVERVVCGLRSVDRGSNFLPFINISDQQTPFGLSIAKGSDAGVSWQTSLKAPTTRSLLVSYSSSGSLNKWNDLAIITLSTTVAREYNGYYRALLRCFYNHASAQAWNLRIQLRFGSGGTQLNTQSVYPTTIADWEAVDFGQLAISTNQGFSQTSSLADQTQIAIQGYCTTLSRPLTLYDLVLIPIDEWAVDARVPEITTTGTPEINVNDYLDIDSISNPKIAISALNRNSAGLIISRYQSINNGQVIFQKNKNQRIWFLNLTYESYWRSYPETVGAVQVFKQQQYLGFRGVR